MTAPQPIERLTTAIRGSQTLRLLSIAVLVLLLQIPVTMISGLVSERQQRRDTAVEEVTSKWGNAQAITGPALVIPFAHRTTETLADGRQISHTETQNAIFLPERLRIRGTLDANVRRRGIFTVPLYRMALAVDGEFAPPVLSELGIDPATVDWSRAHLAVGISDARAIQDTSTVTWNGQSVAFLPGTGGFADGGTGIHAPVRMTGDGGRIAFSFPLVLNGSLRTEMVPFGRTTVVEMKGDYGHPSFQGMWLPTERTVSADAFSARWSVSFLGRSYPQSWTSESKMGEAIEASRFGVALVDPTDHYHMAERSVKYAALFLLLTFATLWLMEVLAGLRVHPIQYLLLGGALCLFYLLELSLSEHLGFPWAYALASVAVIGMVGSYSFVILRRVSRALVVGTGVTLLYAYLYLLLMNEDYALLIGSVGLFVTLGAIMYVTRRVDWYSPGTRALEPAMGDAASGAP